MCSSDLVTTGESGPSIITAAKNLLKAGARENKKKKSLAEMDESMFIESDTNMPEPEKSTEPDNPTETA